MALASLCSKFATANGERPTFSGFIVDHRLRPGSTDEAHKVAKELRRLHISPCILTLDWAQHGDPSNVSHIETLARRLRYQAIGAACRERSIHSLLLAHHADDQAETVAVRLLNRYHGFGFRAMKPEGSIPDCYSLYGIHESGSAHDWQQRTMATLDDDSKPRMLLESGGVQIVRPLLSFRKDELVNYCQQTGVSWCDDHTNHDPTLTMRNTVRYLQQSQVLPAPLRMPRLVALADKVALAETLAEERAQRAFSKTTVRLNLRTGAATFAIDMKDDVIPGSNATERYGTKAFLARKLLRLVTPQPDIPLRDIHGAVDFLFPTSGRLNSKPRTYQIASVQIIRTGGAATASEYAIHRSVPRRDMLSTLSFSQPSSESQRANECWVTDWKLWDNRYWLRVASIRSDRRSCTVRFLTPKDLARLRQSLSRRDRKQLDGLLKTAPGESRFTLPALVQSSEHFVCGSYEVEEDVVALPSLGWSMPRWHPWPCDQDFPSPCRHDGWWWDIRYKHVDLNDDDIPEVVLPMSGG